MREKIKAFMDHPYTRGDYYGWMAVILGLYAVLGAACVVYTKVSEIKSKKTKNCMSETVEVPIEDEEA
jgi:hypothetical protein